MKRLVLVVAPPVSTELILEAVADWWQDEEDWDRGTEHPELHLAD